MPVHRRTRRGRVTAGLIALLTALAACGSSGSTSPTTSAAAGGQSAVSGSPATGTAKMIRVVMPAEPATLNPAFNVYGMLRVLGGMFTPLVGFDKKTLKIDDSGLLTSWERTSPTEWTFTLRSGVKFHDGEPWDTDAAIFTITKYRDEEKSGFRPYHSRITDIKAIGTDKIKVTTKEPYIALPMVFTNDMGLPPKAYGSDGDAFGRNPVGTGPFKLGKFTSGQSLTMVANPDYFGEKAKSAGLEFTWAADPATRTALVQSGGVDIAYDLSPEGLATAEPAPGLKVVSSPTLYKMTLSFNANAGTLADVKLREAAQAAIDYAAISKALFNDKAAVVAPYFAGDVMDKQPTLTYQKFDLDKAKSLVAAAGGSPKVRFLYSTGYYLKDKQVGEAVSAMLEAAGFQVEQAPLEYSEMRKERNTGNYSLYMSQITPVFAHPDSLYAFFSGSAAAVKSCDNPETYDKMQAEGLTATDQAASDKIYQQIEERYLDQDRCAAILYDQVYLYAMSDKLQGFETARDTVPDPAGWQLS